MPVITTAKFLPDTAANPKPARGVNWVGNPIADGEDYFGNKIDGAISDTHHDAPQTSVKASVTRRKRKRGVMSPEARKAFGDRMRAYWQRKRSTDSIPVAPTPDLPSVDHEV